MPRSRLALFVPVWGLFALSWFLPVIDGSCALGRNCLPGWEAAHFAFGPSVDTPWWAAALSIASALTNLLMVATIPTALFSTSRLARGVALGLLAAFLINLQWIPLLESGLTPFRAGFYVWLLSFALAGAALLRVRRLSAPTRS